MVQTPTSTHNRDRSLPQGTLSLTDPRVFREGGKIDFARLNQLADAAKRGVMSGGENFAYEPVKSEKEEDREAKAEKAFLREEVLSSIIENAQTAQDALTESNQPITRTVSIVGEGAWAYTDVTLRKKNGDYVGGMCMAPGAATTTSFAEESDDFATKTAKNEDNIFVTTGKKIGAAYDDVTGTVGKWGQKTFGGMTDSLSSLFSGSDKGSQIKVDAPKPKAPAPVTLGLGYDEPQGPTLGYGA